MVRTGIFINNDAFSTDGNIVTVYVLFFRFELKKMENSTARRMRWFSREWLSELDGEWQVRPEVERQSPDV